MRIVHETTDNNKTTDGRIAETPRRAYCPGCKKWTANIVRVTFKIVQSSGVVDQERHNWWMECQSCGLEDVADAPRIPPPVAVPPPPLTRKERFALLEETLYSGWLQRVQRQDAAHTAQDIVTLELRFEQEYPIFRENCDERRRLEAKVRLWQHEAAAKQRECIKLGEERKKLYGELHAAWGAVRDTELDYEIARDDINTQDNIINRLRAKVAEQAALLADLFIFSRNAHPTEDASRSILDRLDAAVNGAEVEAVA